MNLKNKKAMNEEKAWAVYNFINCWKNGQYGGISLQEALDLHFKPNTCCICGKEYYGMGNNPWPIMDEGECCDECNAMKVVPERIRQVYSR